MRRQVLMHLRQTGKNSFVIFPFLLSFTAFLCHIFLSISLAQSPISNSRTSGQSESLEESYRLVDQSLGAEQEGEFNKGIILLEQALQIQQKILGNTSSIVLETSLELARKYTRIGRIDEAEKLYKQILAIQERYADKNDKDSIWIDTLLSIASLYHWIGRTDEAKKLYSQVFDVYEYYLNQLEPHKFVNDELKDTLVSYYMRLGYYNKAEKLYKRLIEIHESIGRDNDCEKANVLTELAQMYVLQQRYEDAKLTQKC